MKIRISLMPTVVCGHSNLHKIKDKASGGFINGQKLVFLCLVTDIVSIPVGFEFYRPDPELKKWKKNDEKLRRQGRLEEKPTARTDEKPELSHHRRNCVELSLCKTPKAFDQVEIRRIGGRKYHFENRSSSSPVSDKLCLEVCRVA